ncbi:transmembrane protein, putative [Medicago truncatula]|uniref:Transmembrane protein, putative n=1 Tax=Medicago truncatula TaxID=3880 RepID=A0A072TEP8_MEDTR|nr:transmembrane protein, putative [Medicago truncatula]
MRRGLLRTELPREPQCRPDPYLFRIRGHVARCLWFGGLPLGRPDLFLSLFSNISGESRQLPVRDYFFDRVMELVTVICIVTEGLMISTIPCLIHVRGFPQWFLRGDARLLEFLVEALPEDGIS